MAPKTRSQKKQRQLPSPNNSKPVVPMNSKGKGPSNTTGFASLPDELYLEITNYIPSFTLPTLKREQCPPRMNGGEFRYKTLLALSQTCRALRSIFLRYLWQRIEVCPGMHIGNGAVLEQISEQRRWKQYHPASTRLYSEELVRQLETVTIREPGLSLHVNILNVVISGHCFESVFSEFARCLALLPNLHTAQVDLGCSLRFKHPRISHVMATLQKYRYPQIRHLFLSAHAFPLLASCPNVIRILSLESPRGFMDPWATFLQVVNPSVEVLGDLPLQLGVIQLISNRFPNLKEITFTPVPFFDLKHFGIRLLTSLNQLETIQIDLRPNRYNRYGSRQLNIFDERDWIIWIEPTLRAIQAKDKKAKRIIFIKDNYFTVTFPVIPGRELDYVGDRLSSSDGRS